MGWQNGGMDGEWGGEVAEWEVNGVAKFRNGW